MTQLALIADDLTGALDSAAAFASVLGPVRTIWDAAQVSEAAFALDSGTREASAATAQTRLRALGPLLAPHAGRLSFFKVDSLLRGHAGLELDAILSQTSFDAVVIAPAIPFQRRLTRGGRQLVPHGADWQETGEDIFSTLSSLGHHVARCSPGDAVPDGISLWDAETDADLDSIVAGTAGRTSVLYVGAAGLSGALARRIKATDERASTPRPTLPPAPLLGLIGTDHPVMRAQLDAVAGHRLGLSETIAMDASVIASRLAEMQPVFITCTLPPHDRDAARAIIARRFRELCPLLPRPGALFVSGGETLSALCRDLGAEALAVSGEYEPGLPLSHLVGGAWHGLPLISKSGAFGTPDTLQRLVSDLAAPAEKAIA